MNWGTVYTYHSIAGYVYNIIKPSVVCMTCALITCAADTNNVVDLVNAARWLPAEYAPESAHSAQVTQILPCMQDKDDVLATTCLLYTSDAADE